MELYKKTINGISPADQNAVKEASVRIDSLIKPIGSLGELENIAIKLSGITGRTNNRPGKKCMIVMSADNGICEEGVSTCPQSITALQTINILNGMAGISVLSRHAGSDLKVVDIGISSEIEHPNLINKKIRMGTANMVKGPAMSKEEAINAVEVGIDIVGSLVEEGYNLLGTGEMGIGNTSTSSAILMTILGTQTGKAIGKGAGMTDEGYEFKKKTIEKAIEINRPDKDDPVDVLSKVGGLDIAGMAGCFLGAAYYKVPVVIDGFISAAAALIAYKMNPLVRDYMIPSHVSAEPGYMHIMEHLKLNPFLNLGMRLGEGTGCPLAFNIIESAAAIINEMATFEDVSINKSFLIDIREES